MSKTHGPSADSTNERLVRVALELFLKQGYAQTSMQEIVDTAGVTKGAFYHYFRSKDDLVLLAHETYLDRQLEDIEQIEDSSMTSAEKLETLMVHMVRGVVDSRPSVALFLEERRFLTGPRFREVKRRRDTFVAKLDGLLEQGIKRGEFRDVPDTRVVSLGIIGMLTWTYQWLRVDGPLGPDEIGHLFASLVLQGLGKSADRETPGSH